MRGIISPTAHVRTLWQQSGLSQERFACDVLGRDERTVRRWLAGAPMPAVAVAYVARIASVIVTTHCVIVVIERD